MIKRAAADADYAVIAAFFNDFVIYQEGFPRLPRKRYVCLYEKLAVYSRARLEELL